MSEKTYTGQEITVPFTQEGTLKGFEIKGKSVQETREGYNLFDITNATNHFITDEGVVENTSAIFSGYIEVENNTYVTIGSNSYWYNILGFFDADKNILSKKYFNSNNTLDLGEYASDNIEIPEGTVYIAMSAYKETTQLLLAFGQDKEYELYGVSPSSEFPSEIQSVGEEGSIELRQYGKNLFNANAIQTSRIVVSDNGKTITMPIATSGNGSVSTGATLSELCPNLKVGDTAYLLFDKTPAEYNKYIYLQINGNSVPWNQNAVRTIPQDDLDSKVIFYGNRFNQGQTEQVVLTNFRVTKNKDDEWEKNRDNSYVIPLSQPLRSLSNGICDTVEIDGIHRKVGSVVLDGSDDEGWTLFTYGTAHEKTTMFVSGAIIDMLRSNGVVIDFMCNLFTAKSNTVTTLNTDSQWIIHAINNNFYVCIENEKASTVDEFKTWLSENNLEINYQLVEEVIEPFDEQLQIKVQPGVNTFALANNGLQTTISINAREMVPTETPEMYAARDAQPNEGTSVSIEIWTHEDEFVDTLYNTDYEFEGQCIDPKITLNANGAKTLTLGLPLYIIDKKTYEYIENPRWYYITQQYKIRVKQDENINEFVLKDYTESHDVNDQLMININAQSLEEFELSQTGYNITFDENTLYKYNSNEDPNDPDTVPIGVYDADIHFWNEKLLENSEWKYRVESYYPLDTDEDLIEDNRQKINPDLEYKNGPEQFYEADRIIDYNENNEPQKDPNGYEVKKRVVKASKSNIFNIVQDICEAFECWPTFEIKYKDEKIVEKTIVYKNDVPQDAKFSVNYQTNLNSIERVVDSSQIVTKMYVTPIENSNVDNGTITIATNGKNFMKESYLLDLSWYLGENRADTELSNASLIDPNIGMTFAESKYTEPQFELTTTTNTTDTIKTYEKNIRNRNTYIENTSLQLSKDQQELINLKTEREYVQSQKDSAQEIVNNLVDEMALIGTTELRKENKACYLYTQNNVTIIRFSEIGIKALPSAETFNSAINIINDEGLPYYDESQIPENLSENEWNNIKTLQLVTYKVDPIIGTILEAQVVNGKIGTEADYASFKCSFDYDPYDYYKKLIAYWRAKITGFENRLVVLGKSREDGGTNGLIYDLETKVLMEKQNVYLAQKEKNQVIKEFENKFTPYIREGYWENTDFGIYMNQNQVQTHIPDEEMVLKYGQTEESTGTNEEKFDWTKDYICFQIPNQLIQNAEGDKTSLYNIIDINEIEAMNDNPSNSLNTEFRTYIKGTDFSINYGYSSATCDTENRGIYICFYRPESATTEETLMSANTQIYVRVKPRGNNQFIWSGFIKPSFYTENDEQKRKWFCPLEQRITITDTDIILSSIKVKLNTAKINFENNNPIIDKTQYELVYGKDYYTSKEIVDGKTVSRITFYQTTNVPLMIFDGENNNYTIEYNQDITAKYYYNDALEVMKESSVPQTTYNISVLDISEAENFLTNLRWYKPQVGTRVPIYDEELRFKGLVGFINSITFDLLNPQNTQLSITNFKDKFVDLFQKITASTIALQSKEYAYDRSTQIVTVEGGINETILKDTFEKPESSFKVSANSNVTWDYTGITAVSNTLNENGVYAKMKVTSEGIFTATEKDAYGNYVWTTAITPQGINASQLTLGKLDTRQIQIFNSSEPRFLWNENGLYAYGQNEGKTDYETYVLYNENGIKFRQLMHNTNSVLLTNLIKTPNFNPVSDWELNSTDGDIFTATSIEEVEVEGGATVPACQLTLTDGQVSSDVTFNSSSTRKDLLSNHKYYYRVYIKVNGIPELSSIDINGGFTGFYKNIQYSQNNQYIKIDGFVTGVTDTNKFGIQVVLPEKINNWSVIVKKPMIIDVTDSFGETIPSLKWFSDLPDITDTYTWTTEMDVYGDSLRLDWGGLTIGAQNNSLQLTSEDGLVIYHPVTTETNNEKRVRLQLGQWTGKAVKNGTEVVYEELYGLRANNLDGDMIFQITQHGVEFDFTSDLENTISNYSKEAALGAIASTSTANLLKNSCGYVYTELKDANGNPNGFYKFAEWTVTNYQFVFPINYTFEEINKDGERKPIVDNTFSRHAFKLTGDTTGLEPTIEQKVTVANIIDTTSNEVDKPFTFKFLMKGSNVHTDAISCGIRLEMTDASNQVNEVRDIPYTATDGGWQIVQETIRTRMSDFTIKITNKSKITYDDNGDIATGIIYLSDLMVTSGEDTPSWTVSPGEIYNNYVTIGSEGVVVTSGSETGLTVRTVMDSHSFRVETINQNDQVSTNILVDEDSTILGPTEVRGQLDIGILSRLRFTEYNDTDGKDSGVDITLII